ncbi:MAG: YggS family pyridoxal phosphate-dependent enzyme [Arenimonas sp.]
MNNPLDQAFRNILQQIDNANHATERPRTAGLLAVSKMQSAASIRNLAALGQRAFGENYVQEALAKQLDLQDLKLEWHLIGPLQSNKCPEAARHFDWIQSLSRIKLVEPLNRYRPEKSQALNVLIQVNIDGEASKSGCTPNEIDSIAQAVLDSPRLKLRGLMAIPEPSPNPEKRCAGFRELNRLFEQLQSRHPGCDTLSMGMSDDFELAIREGSTLVRIGSALFGTRKA